MNESIPDSPYAAWIRWIEGFAAGQSLPPDGLVPFDDSRLEGYAAQRIFERFAKALAIRLAQWSETLTRELTAAIRRPGASLGPVMVGARRRLNELRETVVAAPLTAELREGALEVVDERASETQQDLEKQLRRNPAASALLAEVRRTPLTARPDNDVRT